MFAYDLCEVFSGFLWLYLLDGNAGSSAGLHELRRRALGCEHRQYVLSPTIKNIVVERMHHKRGQIHVW